MLLRPTALRVTVEEVRDETPTVKAFRLRLPPGSTFEFKPGQFVMVNFPDLEGRGRAYSMTSSPLEKGSIEIALAKVGRFTSRMFSLCRGQELVVEGPFGSWVYKDDIPHAVLISGGTGIAPFRSIARYVLGRGLANRLTLMVSARTPSELLFGRDLEDFARRKSIRLYRTITRPRELAPGERWEGPIGRLSARTVQDFVPDFREAHYYLCGPNSLVEDLSSGLAAARIPKARVRYEKWGDY